MRLRRFRTVQTAIIFVLIITCLIVLLVNYRTTTELQEYIRKESIFFVPGSGKSKGDTTPTSDEDYYIDTFESLLITDRRRHKINGRTCLEKQNFVFIKTMKCATETMASVLRRFGYLRHLNFVLPKQKNIYLGWPYILEKLDYRPSSKPFNILVEHSIYNKTVMSSLMPNDSAYISIIREPYSHFKSAFHYFNVANISKVTGKDQLSQYIHNIDTYERYYKSREGSKIRFCIPDGFSVTKNLLSHCLGMPLGFPAGRRNFTDDLTSILRYIEQLNRDFTLVMIMDYFHESLVLLKRLMCWSLEDIIYHTSNVGNYSYKYQPPKPGHFKVHRQWSSVDYILYEFFNNTLWQKIAKEGESFHREVATYNLIQTQVADYCEYMNDREEDLKISATEFNDEFVVTHDYCIIMGLDLLTFLKTRYDYEELELDSEVQNSGPKRGC